MSWKRPPAKRTNEHRLDYAIGGDGGGKFG